MLTIFVLKYHMNLHPLVQDWFSSHLGSPTEPQQQGWPAIAAGKSVLISAPTGSGKTLAAFLICIDRLVRKALVDELTDSTEVLYVSPLKALSNDIEKNLARPLAEIAVLAEQRGLKMAEIRVALRTGDTSTRDRLAMLRKAPHILVTTPESLYLLLTAEKSRALLTRIKTVIVDEIHALVNDKRGTHLALSLERLAAITAEPPVRIGLSATQKPLDLVARFLVGTYRPQPVIVDIGYARQLDLAIEVPRSPLGPITSNAIWDELYDRIAELARQNRSTLIFVNTRRLAERIAHCLAERLGANQVAAHHGSLSRKIRLTVENKLKNGELTALVATASLELGIDIGTVDLVCQIGSPRAIAVALQRIGRAGHWHGAVAKGRIFATTRNELLECAALVYAIRAGDLDQLLLPQQPTDILAQQIVATCATGEWTVEALYTLITGAYPYANLSRELFFAVLTMLADGIAGSRGRYGAYLHWDRVNQIIRARRGSRMVAITSGGAIPDNGLFQVIAEPEHLLVGSLDEDFAIESNRGDIFLLGSTSWCVQQIQSTSGKVLVEDARGMPPNVPFWRGEAPARTKELSLHVSQLRQTLSDLLGNNSESPAIAATINWLHTHCHLDAQAAEQLIEYLLQGRAILGAVPTQSMIIAERFFDESGGMQLIIHAPFGARINKAWGLALRKRFCRSFNFELQAAATDDGINISLAEQHSFPLADVFDFLHPNTVPEVLTQAVLPLPLFATRWRWDASRSLALPRFFNGKKVPPQILRMRAEDLLAAVFPEAVACQDNLGGRDIALPDHPLVNEAMKDVLTEALDLAGLIQVLANIKSGEIHTKAVDTAFPSPFAHEILNANPYAFLDDAPLEERRARAVEMRRVLPAAALQEVGRLDPVAIMEVQQQVWPDIRNADELHDSLLTLIAWPHSPVVLAECQDPDSRDAKISLPCGLGFGFPAGTTSSLELHFVALKKAGRVATALHQGKSFYFAVEKAQIFAEIYPQAEIPPTPLCQRGDHEIPPFGKGGLGGILDLLRGWLLHLGPVTASELSSALALELSAVEQGLLQLEASGFVLRGHFKHPAEEDEIEWCERRLLARIHRQTINRLRRAIEPVTPEKFMSWLANWQHLAAGTQLAGLQGLREIIRQCQGLELPAKLWERDIFAKRVRDYDAGMLDRLCLSGEVAWGRLSWHSGLLSGEGRIIPNRAIPITFFIREDSSWIPTRAHLEERNLEVLSHVAGKIYHYLQQQGACFFADLVRGVGCLPAEAERSLWELIAAGLVTADSFDNMRALIDPRRRLGRGRHRSVLPRYSGGRWALLPMFAADDTAQQLEAVGWLLLRRYGVIFRDLLAQESLIPRWRELLPIFRSLEDRGEIRGGRFVSGVVGEQFALPQAVESLRS